MKSKQRDKNSLPVEPIQSDNDSFLQVFEKPTQIYRFLRTRHLYRPGFLHRNLTYMKGRSLRKRNTRSSFSLDSLSEKAYEPFKNSSAKLSDLTLTFDGLFDKNSKKFHTAELEAYVIKLFNTQRKFGKLASDSNNQTEINVGKVMVSVNGSEKSDSPSLSVAATQLTAGNPSQVIKLHLKVHCKPQQQQQQAEEDSHPLPAKRRRSRIVEDPVVSHSPVPSLGEEPLVGSGAEDDGGRLYGAELVIVDEKGAVQLTDGEYTLVLSDLQKQHAAAIVATSGRGAWYTANSGKTIDQNALFEQCPTVKFKVSWQNNVKTEINFREPVNGHLDANQNGFMKNSSPTKRKRVFYQFMYNNNTRRQTEARDDLTCPWCILNCPTLYGLLKHLRTCHQRFLFLYSDHPKGARIDVSVNEHYDGSYSGNPHDLYSYMGFAHCRRGPVQRMMVTQAVVFKPPKLSFDVHEFYEPECEDLERPMVDGHDRLYFHTITCTVQYPSEIDMDSDSELHPGWLRQKTQNLIDDFTDVNEGEKEIMKMWNLHVMQHNFIGDVQLPRACAMFISEYGERVIENNLQRNFLLHLINLYDFGLLKPETVNRTMLQLYRLHYKLRCERGEAGTEAAGEGVSKAVGGGAGTTTAEEGRNAVPCSANTE